MAKVYPEKLKWSEKKKKKKERKGVRGRRANWFDNSVQVQQLIIGCAVTLRLSLKNSD